MRISGTSGGDSLALSEMGVAAAAHGSQLLKLGFSVDQVVHDYGDVCQAITDLAFERQAAFPIQEFRTLNRCLDNAIADAVTEFSRLREISLSREQGASANERLGFLVSVGLDYLTLDRHAGSLSGGESQRIRLAIDF